MTSTYNKHQIYQLYKMRVEEMKIEEAKKMKLEEIAAEIEWEEGENLVAFFNRLQQAEETTAEVEAEAEAEEEER